MILEKLALRNFRNYNDFIFSPASRSLIVGDNGKGKTNLLEALTLLFYGRSFRICLPESFVYYQKNEAFVSAQIGQEGKTYKLHLTLRSSTGKKQFFVNNKKSSAFFISSKWPMVLFSPESLTFLKGSAQQRRDWLDLCLIQQGHSKAVRSFREIFRQKKHLLSQIKKDQISKVKAREALASLNEIFSQKSSDLIMTRRLWLKEIKEFLLPISKALFRSSELEETDLEYFVKGLDQEKIFIDANSEIYGNKEETREDFCQKIQKKLEERLGLEMEAGVCLYGPHRDDFKLFFKKKQARYFCSQGQQRGLLLALKLAQIKWLKEKQNKSALLLLDDVFSEIDKHLLLNLLQFLEKISAQMMLTSTKVPSCLNTKNFSIFYLKNI